VYFIEPAGTLASSLNYASGLYFQSN